MGDEQPGERESRREGSGGSRLGDGRGSRGGRGPLKGGHGHETGSRVLRLSPSEFRKLAAAGVIPIGSLLK